MARQRRSGLTYKQARTKAQREADRAKAAERRRLLPAPSSRRGSGMWRHYLPDTEEVRWLTNASLTEQLAGGAGEYLAELRAIGSKAYRAAYNRQQAERRAAGKLKPRPPKARSAWIRVKAHRRRRPGGG